MDFQIHCLETEAYLAVLRAFIAQSEALTWEKETLITELRKELRVSDVEHREILGKINLDDSVKAVREWRKGSDGQQLSSMNPRASDPMSGGHLSRKRLKPTLTPVASSPKFPPHAQLSPFPHIGQPSPMHARDGQWNSNTTVFSAPIQTGLSMIAVPQNRQTSSSGKVGRSVVMHTSKKGVARLSHGNIKPGSEIIEIRATDKIINEVEKIVGGVNPDPGQVLKARLMLREHEKALMDAIGKLGDVSDGDDSPNHGPKQQQYANEGRDRNAKEFHSGPYQQFAKKKIGHHDGYSVDHAERPGIPCIDLQDDYD